MKPISILTTQGRLALAYKAYSALFLIQGATASIGSSAIGIQYTFTTPAEVAINRQAHPVEPPSGALYKFIEQNELKPNTPNVPLALMAIVGAGCTATGALMNHRLKRVKIEEWEKLKDWATKLIKRDEEPKRETDSNQVLEN